MRQVRKYIVKDNKGEFQSMFLRSHPNFTRQEYLDLKAEYKSGMTARSEGDYGYRRNFPEERKKKMRPLAEEMNQVS